MNPEITEPEAAAQANNAVSIFGQGGSPNDFPVLKAFQEYIDAEQAKARKRMLGLSIFFIVLLVVIVITFTLVVMSVINRNQSLSDRLLDIALREKSPAQPVVNVQSPAPTPVVQPVVHPQEESLKPVMEEIGKLSAALVKAQQQQPIPVAQPAPVVVTTSPQHLIQPTSESAELARLREELRREKEERKAEQAKAKEEKRQAEIEAHRRRLYPEYYAQQDARRAVPARAEQTATPAENAKPTETVGRAARPLPNPVQQLVIAPERHPLPNPVQQVVPVQQPVPVHVQQPVPVQQPIREPEPPPRSVTQPVKPVQAQVVKPTPQIEKTVTPQANTGKIQPLSYFNGAMPDEDPELKELLKKVPPVPVQQPMPQPQVKPTQRTVPQPRAKPVQKSIAAPVVKPEPKPAVNPPSKSTLPPPVTPVVQLPVQQEKKTETLAIGGADGNSIPWLIEIPQN